MGKGGDSSAATEAAARRAMAKLAKLDTEALRKVCFPYIKKCVLHPLSLYHIVC